MFHAEPTLLIHRKATSSALDWPGVGGPPGSKSGACTQGSSRNLGYLVFSTVERRRGRRGTKWSRLSGKRPVSEGAKAGEAVVVLSEGNEVRRDGGREVGVG